LSTADTLTPLQKAQAAQKAMRDAGIAIRPKNPLEKLAERPDSLRLAVNAKCYQCEGEDADPSVKWRIGNRLCEDTCALYAVRPYQHLQGAPTPAALRWRDET